jgi:hypothetical protein
MPDASQVQPVNFALQGGLVLNKSTFAMQPGEALELINFEPDIEGGYRRINGFSKYNTNIVPQTSASSEEVLMSTFFNDNIIAARGEKIFRSTNGSTTISQDHNATVTTITVASTTGFTSTGTIIIGSEQITYTGTTSTTFTGATRGANSTTAASHTSGDAVTQYWTEIDTGRTSAGVYTFEEFNFDNNLKFVVADGNNAPTVFNTSFTATDVSNSSVAGAKFVASFRDHMFYAGMSSTPQELVFSKPFDEDDFSSGAGSGTIAVDATITGIKVFRDNLFIFCENRIFKLAGSSVSDFTITDVTRNIGCINGQTIQEFSGDLIFLAPDGLRTVAGTARIGDVELGTISTPIQTVFNDNIANSDAFRSVVIPNKTQYRLFFSKSDVTEANTNGVVCSLRGQQFEFGKLQGIKPSSTGILVTTSGTTIVHGGTDGYVYQQESGNDFDGTAVNAKYRSPDLSFGDAGIRKHLQRVLVSYKPEAAVNADLFLRYDYEDPDSPRPAAYSLSAADIVAVYGSATYGVATYGGQTEPLLRQSVEGSGFTVALRVNDDGTSAPYALRGFGLEYQVGARR